MLEQTCALHWTPPKSAVDAMSATGSMHASGTQPHEPNDGTHWQLAALPQAGPASLGLHGIEQKYVSVADGTGPLTAALQNVAALFCAQSEYLVQYRPTPRLLPISPGVPHADGRLMSMAAADRSRPASSSTSTLRSG
jgi:hypothetical protein